MRKCFLVFYLLTILPLSYGQCNYIPWKVSSMEEQGMNSMTFINGIKRLKQDSTKIHSLLVIRNNHIVADAYFYPFRKNYVHDLASVTKSVTSLLIGIAIDKGFIKNEDQLVYTYFPEITVKNDTLKTLKIKDLLNMSSGLKCSWNNGEKELKQMNESEDWVRFMFSLPFETIPGKKFSYCSGNFYLLAEILQRTTKMTSLDFAKKFLFQSLDFGDTFWLKNNQGVNHGWGDLYISAYDMAKIGCLILNDGKWNDKQLISKEWLEKIKPLYKVQKTESYGYGWWLDSENPDEIQAVGRGGQRLFIFKERNMVIAMTGGGFEAGDIDNLVLESINSFEKDKNYSTQLENLINTLQYPDAKNTAISKDNFSINNLNKSYHFERNELKLNDIRFEQRDKHYYFIINFLDGTKEEHLIGIDNQYNISKECVLGLPLAIKGFWDNDKLIIYYNDFCRINLFKFTFTFSATGADLYIQDQTDHWEALLKGNIIN